MAKEIHALKNRNGNIFWPATASSAVVHPNTRKSLTEHITVFNLTDQNITTLSAAINKLGSGTGNYGFSNLALGSQVVIKNSSGETEEYTFYKGNTDQFTTAGNWRKTNAILVIDSALDNTTNLIENQAVNSAITNINTVLNNKADLVNEVLKTDQVPNISVDKLVSGSVNPTIPSSLLPSYVDDVLEYAGQSNFPETGEAGKIYVDITDRKTYRWSGSEYVEISASLTLGENSSTAFPGNRGLALETWKTNTVDPFITNTTSELNPSVSGSLANTVNTLNTGFSTLDSRVDALDDITNPSSLVSRVGDLESEIGEKTDNTHGNLSVNWETPTSDWTSDTTTYSNLTKDTAIDKLGEILPNAVAKSVKKVTDFIKPIYIDLTLDPEYNNIDGSLATEDTWWEEITEDNHFYEFTKGYLFSISSSNYTEDPFAVTTITSGYDSTNNTLETETRLHPNIILRIHMKDFDTESSTYGQIQNYLFISLTATDDISYDFPGTDGNRRQYVIFSGIGAFEGNVYHAFIQFEETLVGDFYECVLYKEESDNIQSLPVFAQDTPVYVGDSYDTAFGKLVQIINHNELIVAAALSDLDSRIVGTLIPTTYNEIKQLRNDSALIGGAFYRITDFVTTTAQTNTNSAGHGFDIVVQALSPNTLNEKVGALQNSNDTYFSTSNLSAWELKYCLDNDNSRFSWADVTNGKGVIYYMKDEYGNECSYDFKNIRFLRYAVDGRNLSNPLQVFYSNSNYDWAEGEGIVLSTGYSEFNYSQRYPYYYYAVGSKPGISGDNAFGFIKKSGVDGKYFYTFNGVEITNLLDSEGNSTNVIFENYEYDNYDLSTIHKFDITCQNNKIGSTFDSSSGKYSLPSCVIYGEAMGQAEDSIICASGINKTSVEIENISIDNDCTNITIAPNGNRITIGSNNNEIIIGYENTDIQIGSNNNYIAIGDGKNTIGLAKIGDNCLDIYLSGTKEIGRTDFRIGSNCSNVVLGEIISTSSIIAESTKRKYTDVGNFCQNIEIDGNVNVGQGCSNIRAMSFFDLMVGESSNNILLNDCSYLNTLEEGVDSFTPRGTVEVLPGFDGEGNTPGSLTELDSIDYACSSIQYVAKNSRGEVISWCPADHISS